jgi:hypothetical protein
MYTCHPDRPRTCPIHIKSPCPAFQLRSPPRSLSLLLLLLLLLLLPLLLLLLLLPIRRVTRATGINPLDAHPAESDVGCQAVTRGHLQLGKSLAGGGTRYYTEETDPSTTRCGHDQFSSWHDAQCSRRFLEHLVISGV